MTNLIRSAEEMLTRSGVQLFLNESSKEEIISKAALIGMLERDNKRAKYKSEKTKGRGHYGRIKAEANTDTLNQTPTPRQD